MILAPLRIPTGWLVEWNVLEEPIGTADLPPLDILREDLLLVSNRHRRVAIDLSWTPEFRAEGSFKLTAARLEEETEAAAEAWWEPLRREESRSYSEIIAILEDWLEDETLTGS
jgi:hypothetical protein